MGTPYVGEVRMFAGNFPPVGWAFCHGQVLPIAENEVLFALIGTTYGGDGQTTFALPDLRGRIPVHQGAGFIIGERAGTETVQLTLNQIPAHTHAAQCVAGAGNQATPTDGVWAGGALNQYSSGPPNATMKSSALASTGGGQAHDNMMPYLAVSFIISLFGIFPSQN